MNKLVDHLFVFEGDGVVTDFPGNYNEYLDFRNEKLPEEKNELPNELPKKSSKEKSRLSYHEKREFTQLEKELEQLEKRKAQLAEEMNSGNLEFEVLQKKSLEYSATIKAIEEKTDRWLVLSELTQ